MAEPDEPVAPAEPVESSLNIVAYVDERTAAALDRIIDRVTGLETSDEVQDMVYEEFMRGADKP
jgi:hypothetical protein